MFAQNRGIWIIFIKCFLLFKIQLGTFVNCEQQKEKRFAVGS